MVLQTILEEPYEAFNHAFEPVGRDNIEADFTFDRDVPSRPSSRLGFNDAIDEYPLAEDEIPQDVYAAEECPAHPRHVLYPHISPDTVKDHHILSPSDDSSSSSPSFDDPRFSRFSSSSPLSDDAELSEASDEDDSDIDTEVDSDGSSYSDIDDDTPFPPSSPPLSPSPSPSIHEFAPLADPSSDWIHRPKFSCLPSPLSPAYTYCRRQNPARHYYQNHGHSRHALHHLKWFWATREDEYAPETYDIFGDIFLHHPSPPHHTHTLVSGPGPGRDGDGPRSPLPSSRPCSSLPPLSIHPRRGDLLALRDPYCTHIDRYFVNMPLWTMAKTLWMHDVHACALGGSSPGLGLGEVDVDVDVDVEDEERSVVEDEEVEEGEYERSHSVGFSDDSDSTLVESDAEGDVGSVVEVFSEPESLLVVDKDKDDNHPLLCPPLLSVVPEAGPSSSSSSGGNKTKGSLHLELLEQGVDGDVSSSKVKGGCNAFWPRNWYRRWEVLVKLCFENKQLPDAEPPSPPALPTTAHRRDGCCRSETVRKKARRFFISDDDDDAWVDALPPFSPEEEEKDKGDEKEAEDVMKEQEKGEEGSYFPCVRTGCMFKTVTAQFMGGLYVRAAERNRPS